MSATHTCPFCHAAVDLAALQASIRSRSLYHVCADCHAPLSLSSGLAFGINAALMGGLITLATAYALSLPQWAVLLVPLAVAVPLFLIAFFLATRVRIPRRDGASALLFQYGWDRDAARFRDATTDRLAIRYYLDKMERMVRGGAVARQHVDQVTGWIQAQRTERDLPAPV
jgi:hypothetical protein